jgi:hypothetical protein
LGRALVLSRARRRAQIERGDVGAVLGEATSDRPALPAGTTADDGEHPFETFHRMTSCGRTAAHIDARPLIW